MSAFADESRPETSRQPGRAAAAVSMNAARDGEYVLEMEHVGKRFDQVWVLKDVNVRVRRGSIHAIVGHNGAGKSTLMKIALGAEKPTNGEARAGAKRITFSRPPEGAPWGLVMA